jgi:acetate kinase
MRALALNAGSGMLKAALYELEPGAVLALPRAARWRAELDWNAPGDGAPADALLRRLCDGPDSPLCSPDEVDVVGHRVVHGGARFRQPTRITGAVKRAMAGQAFAAPLHNTAALRAVAAAERFVRSATPQIAVFDTAFHADPMPAAFTGPRIWLEPGLRRCGFHGINHRYAAHRAASMLGEPLENLRLITCHLGLGGSLVAVRDGESVGTAIGFATARTRPRDGWSGGAPDPGLVLHLLRDPEATSSTVAAFREQGASQSFELCVQRLRFQIEMLLTTLGGLDAIVFTAGGGRNGGRLREAALATFGQLGLELDPVRNSWPDVDADIAAAASAVRVLVVRPREEWAIACTAADLISGHA